MLVQINYPANPYFEEFLKGVQDRKLRYYASDLQEKLGFEQFSQLAEAVRLAMRACRSQQIPLGEHFKAIYRCRERGMVQDWKLSGLGYGMLILNSNAGNPFVARLQLELIRRSGLYT